MSAVEVIFASTTTASQKEIMNARSCWAEYYLLSDTETTRYLK